MLPPTDGVSELLRKVQRLELLARRNAVGRVAGDYLTAVRGQGMIFHETRKYVPGDPVRRIDWNTTARLGEPYVKVHLEERQREVWVLLDVSPSMHVGFRRRTKLELAVELAATLAVSAIDGGDRLGWAIFADEILDRSPPRGGRAQLFRGLRSFLTHTAPWRRSVRESDPRVAIHALEAHRKGRFVVFLISDFIDHDIPEDLKYLRARHDVSLLHVYDPVEYEATDDVLLWSFSPEGSAKPSSSCPGSAGSLSEMREFLRGECRRSRMAFDSFSTEQPVGPALDHFFHRR